MRGKSGKLVQGVGINDSPYKCSEGTKQDKSYTTWFSMLHRCYNEREQNRNPSYHGCYVCNDWLRFTTFRDWFDTHYVSGFELDKDLLFPGNKVYCPDTCIFVPHWVNSFVTDCTRSRGELPVGVKSSPGGKFQSRCQNPKLRIRHHLGTFPTPEEAHEAWRKKKVDIIRENKSELDSIDIRLYPALTERYKKGSVHI